MEDNPDDEVLTLMALEGCITGSDIDVVRDGSEALDYLWSEGRYASSDLKAEPSLVLLDLKLPKLSGLEVLKRMRADTRTKHLPVVVFTSSIEERDMVDSYHLGANSYVQKPINMHEFDRAVKQVGAYWLELNDVPSRF